MEVIKTRQKFIKKAVHFMLLLSWESKLGRVLIQKGEINPLFQKIEEVELFLEKASYTIHMKERVLMPMGSLKAENVSLENLNFYFLSINNGIQVITSKMSQFPQMRLRKIDQKRSENALIYWFRDLQMNPTSVRDDLQKIKDILRKKGG